MEELWKKKQSDVLRFLLRVRCWEYRQLPGIMRLTGPSRPDKARRLGYRAKQGIVIYRVRIRRGGRKKPISKVRFDRLTKTGVLAQELQFRHKSPDVQLQHATTASGGVQSMPVQSGSNQQVSYSKSCGSIRTLVKVFSMLIGPTQSSADVHSKPRSWNGISKPAGRPQSCTCLRECVAVWTWLCNTLIGD